MQNIILTLSCYIVKMSEIGSNFFQILYTVHKKAEEMMYKEIALLKTIEIAL